MLADAGVVFMSYGFLNRLTAIEYRRFALAEGTGRWCTALPEVQLCGSKFLTRREGEFFGVGEVAQPSHLTLVCDESGLEMKG